jgi:glyoxylase-like metal-dependent hydrolase (beta-lactamase superfamily II)
MGPRAIQITEEVFQVGGRGLTAAEDGAIYLIALPGHAALVDAGCGDGLDMLLANIESLGVQPQTIEYLLLTHCHFDHTGGAAALRRRLGCRVLAHELDAPYIERGDAEVTAASWYGTGLEPCPVDVRLSGETNTIVLGGRSIVARHMPGHSPGSLVFELQSCGRQVLFAQDVHGPLHPSLLSDRGDYQASLRRLRDLDADILCEGHFGVFRGKHDARRFVSQFIEGDAGPAD